MKNLNNEQFFNECEYVETGEANLRVCAKGYKLI